MLLDDDVGIAIVVEIADRQAATDLRDLQPGSGARGRVAKAAAEIEQQLVLLPVRLSELRIVVDVGEDVPVCEEEIELAVEIGVEEAGAPAHRRECGSGEARRPLTSSN